MHAFATAGIAVLAAISPMLGAPMTKKDRQQLLAHFDMTDRWLADEIAMLSAAQLEFRSAPGTWSIKDVLEHLAVAEPQYWQQLQDSLKEAIDQKSDVTDEAILWYGIDRTQRNRTGEAREPKGQFETAGKAFDSWRKLRGTMREYATTTEDDLRRRLLKGSKMAVYQWFLMISTHSQRHILQIREIKQHADFPKK